MDVFDYSFHELWMQLLMFYHSHYTLSKQVRYIYSDKAIILNTFSFDTVIQIILYAKFA